MNDKKIFLCHSSINKKIGDMFFNAFHELGIKKDNIFYSSKDINGVPLNEEISPFIKQQISASDLVIVLVSKQFLKSAFCLSELGVAWALNKKLLTILIDDYCLECKIDFVISTHNYIDFLRTDDEYLLSFLNKELNILNNQKNLLILQQLRNEIKKSNNHFLFNDLISLKNITKNEQKKLEKITKKFSKPITTETSLEKFLNDIFNSKQFINALFASLGNDISYSLVAVKIAAIINYYLLSRDLTANFKLLYDIMNSVQKESDFVSKQLVFEGIKKTNKVEKNSDICEILRNNFLKNGYVSHSCNPKYLNLILENGFSKMDKTSFSEQNLEDLENIIYKNKFLSRQNDSKFYYSLVSANAVHYALNMSPERVFGGPLKNLSENSKFDDNTRLKDVLPVRVGESIKHYFFRIAKNNIDIIFKNSKIEKSFKKIIKRKMKNLVDDFCFDYSYLLLIPTQNGEISCFNRSVDKNNLDQNLKSYINSKACGTGVDLYNCDDANELFECIKYITPKGVGVDDYSLMGNLCSNKPLTNTSNILKIKIPVYYKIMQTYLKKHCFGKKIKVKLNPYIED